MTGSRTTHRGHIRVPLRVWRSLVPSCFALQEASRDLWAGFVRADWVRYEAAREKLLEALEALHAVAATRPARDFADVTDTGDEGGK